MIVALLAEKGGTGKTTLATNLAGMRVIGGPEGASDRRRPTGQRSLLGEGSREVLSTEGQLGSATRRLVRQASAKPRSQV